VRAGETPTHTNRPLWKRSEREFVAHFLSEAQMEIEQVTNYPLCPTWYEDEEHDYSYPILSKWRKVIAAGVRATTSIAASTAVDYSTEPATIGPLATTVTDTDEVHVFYPNSEYEIEIQRIQIVAGQLTIWIPRCRLTDPDLWDTQEEFDYDDLGDFTDAVDVTRVYNDPSTHADLVWTHGKTPGCTCPSCTEDSETACLVITDAEIGEMDVQAANYSSGSWTRQSWSCYCSYPDRVRINYLAGLTEITPQAEDAVLRLAHSKMPHDPCNCDPPNWLWVRDKEIPKALTRERLNCPFGLSNGAWVAYRFAKAMEVVRGYVL